MDKHFILKGTRRFGDYPGNDPDKKGINTADASYEEGWWCGVGWDHKKHNYVPGGPHVSTYNVYERKHPDWIAYCNATQENNYEWRRGWHDGCQFKWEPPSSQVDHCAVLGYN